MTLELKTRGVTRRSALRLLLTGAGATLLAACAPIGPASPPAGTLGTSAAAPAGTSVGQVSGQPRSGGTLRLGMAGDLTSLDGHLIIPGGFDTIWTVYDTLTQYDRQLKPQPMLAESWDTSSDFKQVKLTLRKGAQFHSGRELTSDDIKWNLLRVRDPKVGVAQLGNMSNWFTGIETPDKYTVELTSDQSRPAVFDLFEYLNILDQQTMEGPDAKTKAVGTGPFTLVEWAQGDHLRFSKNPNYWQSGKPYLDGFEVKIITDPQALVTQLEGGALDAVLNPALRDSTRLKQDPKYQVVVNDLTGQYYLIAVNTTLAPTDNKLVRQALNYAIDRKRFVESVLLGTGDARDLPWPPQAPAYEPAKNATYSFDLDKARSLLAQAGASNVNLDAIYSGNSAEAASLGQIYQADLTKIGITINLKPLESLVWRDQTDNVKYRGLNLSGSGFAGIESASLFSMSRYWNPQINASGFKSDQYTQLINQAASEPDAAKRKQIYYQLNDYLLDQSFVIPLAPQPPTVVTTAGVHGIRHTIHEALSYTDTWLSA